MNDQIICPNCKSSIPLSEALSHQIQEKYQKFYKIRLAEETAKIETHLKSKLTERITADLEMKMKDKSNEAEELKKQNKTFQEQILELNRLVREIKTQKDQQGLEMEKNLRESEDKIRHEEQKKYESEFKLKLLEKDKKLDDAMKLVDEYKTKLEQGSQQLQGEVLELEMENTLKTNFPTDEIKPVPKGIRGADMVQNVKNSYGRECGSILWESKRTKTWSNDWLLKLKADQREMKADIAVLISKSLPEGVTSFELVNGVWVGNYECISGLASVLRQVLLEVSQVKNANINRQNKMEVIYQYFTGLEFKQRLESMIESYSQLQLDLEKEKRFFSTKWAKQEKYIRSVFDNLSGMYGDMQSMIGKALPEVKGLDMLTDGQNEEENKTLF